MKCNENKPKSRNIAKESFDKIFQQPQNQQECLYFYFIICILIICVALMYHLVYFKNRASLHSKEMMYFTDVHLLRCELIPQNVDQMIGGFVEVLEIFGGISIIGNVKGLKAGSSHGIYALEYNLGQDTTNTFNHFNPNSSGHSCPSRERPHDSYHKGDFGNILADKDGVASFSIVKRNEFLSDLTGRQIVITNKEDPCDDTIYSIKDNFSIASCVLSVTTPKHNFKNEEEPEQQLRPVPLAIKEGIKKLNEKEVRKFEENHLTKTVPIKKVIKEMDQIPEIRKKIEPPPRKIFEAKLINPNSNSKSESIPTIINQQPPNLEAPKVTHNNISDNLKWEKPETYKPHIDTTSLYPDFASRKQIIEDSEKDNAPIINYKKEESNEQPRRETPASIRSPFPSINKFFPTKEFKPEQSFNISSIPKLNHPVIHESSRFPIRSSAASDIFVPGSLANLREGQRQNHFPEFYRPKSSIRATEEDINRLQNFNSQGSEKPSNHNLDATFNFTPEEINSNPNFTPKAVNINDASSVFSTNETEIPESKPIQNFNYINTESLLKPAIKDFTNYKTIAKTEKGNGQSLFDLIEDPVDKDDNDNMTVIKKNVVSVVPQPERLLKMKQKDISNLYNSFINPEKIGLDKLPTKNTLKDRFRPKQERKSDSLAKVQAATNITNIFKNEFEEENEDSANSLKKFFNTNQRQVQPKKKENMPNNLNSIFDELSGNISNENNKESGLNIDGNLLKQELSSLDDIDDEEEEEEESEIEHVTKIPTPNFPADNNNPFSLLNFKQLNKFEPINISTLDHKIRSAIPLIRPLRNAPIQANLTGEQNILSESATKMQKVIDEAPKGSLVDQMAKSDKGKLFITNLKKSIGKLDKMLVNQAEMK